MEEGPIRPKLGDRVRYKRGTAKLEATVIAVSSKTGVHYLLRTNGGRLRRIGLSNVIQIINPVEKE